MSTLPVLSAPVAPGPRSPARTGARALAMRLAPPILRRSQARPATGRWLTPQTLMPGLLLALGLALAPRPAAASPTPAEASLAAAADAARLLAEQAGAAGLAGRRVEISVGELSPRLRLAPCSQIEPYLPPGFRAWGSTRVGLRCVDGPVRWNVQLPLSVKVWGEALVPAQPLPAGHLLQPGDLVTAEVDLAALPSPALDDPARAEGRVLARSLAPGQALRAADLRARLWFPSGATVQIVAVGSGFSIASRGQALGQGLDGQTVRVRLDNGRTVSGVAVADDRVELRL